MPRKEWEPNKEALQQIRALVRQLDLVEERALELPPVWQEGDDSRVKNKYPPHILKVVDKSLAEASHVPDEHRTAYMGHHALASLRGQPPPKYNAKFRREERRRRKQGGGMDQLRQDLSEAAEVARMTGTTACASRVQAFHLSDKSEIVHHVSKKTPTTCVLSTGMVLKSTHEKPPQVLHVPTERLSIECVHELMNAADEPPPYEGFTPRRAADIRASERERLSQLRNLRGEASPRTVRGPVTYDLETFGEKTAVAQRSLSHKDGTSIALENGINSARLQREIEKELRKERRRAMREHNAISAEEARIEYGPTARERKLTKDAEGRFERETLEAKRLEAQHNLCRSKFTYIVVAALYSLFTTVWFQVSEFPELAVKNAAGAIIHYMESAPFEVILATSGGGLGAALLIIELVAIRLILAVEGFKSEAIIRLTPFFVYVQYLSMLLQTTSLAGFLLFLLDADSGLTTRSFDRMKFTTGSESWTTVFRFIMGILVPFTLAYSVWQGRQLCLQNLQFMGRHPRDVQKHILIAITCCEVVSCCIFMSISIYRIVSFYDNFLNVDAIPTYATTQTANASSSFDMVNTLTYPFLEYAFGTSTTFEAEIYGCSYSIPVEPDVSLGAILDASTPGAADYFHMMGSDLTTMYNMQVMAVDTMIAAFVNESLTCGLSSGTFGAELDVMASWSFIQNPSTYIEGVARAALATAGFNLWVPLALSLVCFAMCFFFLNVSLNFLQYEQECKDFPEYKLEIKTAGRRVLLIQGTDVMLEHVVGMPRLNGMRGKLKDHGYDEQGQVAVEMQEDGSTRRVEEWNLRKLPDEGHDYEAELQKTRELAVLRVAEAEVIHYEKGIRLSGRETAYTIMCQIIAGISMHGLLSFFSTAKYAGISGYAVLAQASALDTGALHHYAQQTCHLWLQCIAGAQADFCGSCSVALPSGMTFEDIVGTTVPTNWALFFSEDGDGDSPMVAVLVTTILAGGIGLIVITAIVRIGGDASWNLSVLCGLIASVPLFIGGFGLWVFSPTYYEPSLTKSSICSDPGSFWSHAGGYDPVTNSNPMELQCVVETGVDLSERETRDISSNALYIAFMINQFYYLLDSTFTLSKVLSSLRGVNSFAKLEITVFKAAWVVAMCVLFTIRIIDGFTGWSDWLSLHSYRFVFFSEQAYNQFGAASLWSKFFYIQSPLSPLASNQALAIQNLNYGCAPPQSSPQMLYVSRPQAAVVLTGSHPLRASHLQCHSGTDPLAPPSSRSSSHAFRSSPSSSCGGTGIRMWSTTWEC